MPFSGFDPSKLLEASYRGVPFHVTDSDYSGGRRFAKHEFPQRDLPFVEDLGNESRVFNVEAFLIGADYRERREQLRARIESPGTGAPYRPGGTLVHPYFGRVHVFPGKFRIRETTRDGGMAVVSVEFHETGWQVEPGSTVDPHGPLSMASAEVADQAGAEVQADLVHTGVPASVRASTETELRKLGRQVQALDVFASASLRVASIARAATRLVEQAASLATSPAELVTTVRTAVDGILLAVDNAGAAMSAYELLAQFGPTLTGGSSASDQAADGNARLVAGLVQQLSLAWAVRAASETAWEHRQAALEARDRLAASIDQAALDSAGAAFLALQKLRHHLVVAVPDPSANLPSLRSLTLEAVQPALVVAYRLYGDRSREPELVDRARVRNPLQVPAGVELEVLSA